MMDDPAGVSALGFRRGATSRDRNLGMLNCDLAGRCRFLLAVAVPAGKELIIFSGHTPPVIDAEAAPDSVEAFGDTYTQTVGAFRELGASLAQLGLGFGNLIQIRALVVGDPALNGRMDSAGFSRAYPEFFGTAENQYLVARTRLQIVGLVNPGWLVELEATAAR